MTALLVLAVLAADARFVMASSANVRKAADAEAPVVTKLPIATEVSLLETKGEWVRVKAPAHEGWVLAELLGAEKPTLEAMNAKYEATPKGDAAGRRKWAERAAAVAPNDVPALQRLLGEVASDPPAFEVARHALATARAAAGQISVGATHLRLVYDAGSESACMYEDGRIAGPLWNTIIGEGNSGGASRAVSFTVDVLGPPGTVPAGRFLEVEASEGSSKPKLKKRVKLTKLDKRGKASFDFKVNETGCDTLRVTARIAGQPDAFEQQSEVPFECGE